MREWLNRAVSKTVEPSRVPWVRIPPSPPEHLITFAVEVPKKGIPTQEFSTLLGHSSARILKARVAKTWETFGVIEGGETRAR